MALLLAAAAYSPIATFTAQADSYPATFKWHLDNNICESVNQIVLGVGPETIGKQDACLQMAAACRAHQFPVVSVTWPDGGDENKCTIVINDGGFNRNVSGPIFLWNITCPYGGSLINSQCENAPACLAGKTRDFVSGACTTSLKNTGGGGCREPNRVGNPCNAGTGTKFQVETIYRGSGAAPLVEQLSYNSHVLADPRPNWTGAYGTGWKGHYERRITVLGILALIRAERPDGQELEFHPPSSGNIFTSDDDVSDRLERLVDGAGNTTGWKYTVAADDSIEIYGPTGKLLSIANRAGLTSMLAYSDATVAGLLITVSDPWGRAIQYTYDSQARITRMTDPAGGTYDYAYDASGNLATITYPDGAIRTYLYNEHVEPANYTQGANLPNHLTGITDENLARFATYNYDTQGRVVSTEHAGGAQKVALEYTVDGVSTKVTDTLGAIRTYGITTKLGVMKNEAITPTSVDEPCPSCGPAVTTYDPNGNVASRTDWNGVKTCYGYNARNLETVRVEGLPGTTECGSVTLAGAALPAGSRKIVTEWHPTFRIVARMAEPKRITEYVYNGDSGASCGFNGTTLVPGVLCSKVVKATTTDDNGASGFDAAPSDTRSWSYTYNANGQVLTMDGPRTDVADVTTYAYWGNTDPSFGKRGNLQSITNAAGHITGVGAHNAHGQPLVIYQQLTAGDLNNWLTTTLTYDLRQRLTSRNVGGELTTYTYDSAGQLIKVTLPDNSFLSYSYDPAHRLTGIQDNLGNRIAYELDWAGNRIKECIFALGVAGVCNDSGYQQATQFRRREYSSINRLSQELGAQIPPQTTDYTYDDQGNVKSVKDPLNHTTNMDEYDALNRLKQVTDPIGGVTKYSYNGLDALTKVEQVVDPSKTLVTSYTVDGLGNLKKQSSPDTLVTFMGDDPVTGANGYDAAGNLLKQTDAKSQVTTYAYDALSRVTLITFHDGSKQAYAYDQGANGVGRLSSITETNPANVATSVIAYAYNQKGRVTSETRTVNGVSYVLAYAYDSSGRLSGLTYPSGRTVTYGRDSLGRVNQITVTKGPVSRIVVREVAYHPFGEAKSWILGNDQSYSRTVDTDGRIASYTLGATTYGIGFDAASRITGIGANTYGYDNLDRLTSAILPSSNFGYSYDAVGNRLSKTIGANTDQYTYSSTSNRIETLTPSGAPPRSFTLDANGSTTDDALNQFIYDARGRMVQATNAASLATTYQVNALGQRIRKTNSQGDTVFHYDTGGRLIAESDPAGAVKREYLYLGDIPVGVLQ
jgi:YD repeat-containing protein